MAASQRLLAPIAAGLRSSKTQRARSIVHALAGSDVGRGGVKMGPATLPPPPAVMTTSTTTATTTGSATHVFSAAFQTTHARPEMLTGDRTHAGRCPMMTAAAAETAAAETRPAAADETETTPTAAEKTIHDLDGPPCWPIIGNLATYLKKKNKGRLHEVMAEYHDQYGRLFKEKLGPLLQIHISDASIMEQMVRHETKYPDRPAFNSWKLYRRVAGESCGIITGSNEEWYRARQVLNQRMLPPKTVDSYGPALSCVRDALLDRIRYLRETDGDEQMAKTFANELSKWGMESIGIILFEQRMGCLDRVIPSRVQTFVDAIISMLTSSLQIIVGEELHKKYNTRFWQRHQAAWDSIFEIGKSYVDEKVTELAVAQAQSRTSGSEEQQDGFLVHLLTNNRLTMSEIYANVTELMLAGVDTSANTMGFLLHLVATHPEVQDKLCAELTRVLGGRPATAESFNHMPYMKCVLKETLRLYPVVTMNVRVLQEDLVIRGYRIPAKTHCIFNWHAMGRDEAYFTDAHKFVPERWQRHLADKPHPFSSLPFGYGVRSCLGKRIAKLEINMALAGILQNFRLEPIAGLELKPTLRTILATGPTIPVRFVDR